MTAEIWACDRPEWFVCSGWAKNDSWICRRRCRRRGMAGTWGGGTGWCDMGTFEPTGASGIKSRQFLAPERIPCRFSIVFLCLSERIWWTCVTLLVETEPLNVLLAGKHCTSCCANCCTGSCLYLLLRCWSVLFLAFRPRMAFIFDGINQLGKGKSWCGKKHQLISDLGCCMLLLLATGGDRTT